MTNITKKRIILAGGSGFLGRKLAATLQTTGNYEPVILTRTPENYRGVGRAVRWDGENATPEWQEEIEGAHAVINLAGKNVNCRPTKRNREEILTSRTNSVRAIGEALRAVRNPPGIWIQASSLAIYGDAKDRVCDEAARVSEAWPANVCTAWEEELGRAILPDTRWVALRIGFVLGEKDGALPFLARLVRFGLGGNIRNGRQWISWLHETDMIRLFIEALENPECAGVYNATNDSAVRNCDLMATLRRVLKRPWSPPAPAFAVKIGAPILGSDPVIALTGRHCISKRLGPEHGFEFQYNHLETALKALFKTQQ